MGLCEEELAHGAMQTGGEAALLGGPWLLEGFRWGLDNVWQGGCNAGPGPALGRAWEGGCPRVPLSRESVPRTPCHAPSRGVDALTLRPSAVCTEKDLVGPMCIHWSCEFPFHKKYLLIKCFFTCSIIPGVIC